MLLLRVEIYFIQLQYAVGSREALGCRAFPETGGQGCCEWLLQGQEGKVQATCVQSWEGSE